MHDLNKLPVIYLPHGGGPWHVLKNAVDDREGYTRLKYYLVELGEGFKNRITSILVISAHWEENLPAIHFGQNPGMFYDYSGFPQFTYKLKWPAPGSPELAARIEKLLAGAGIQTKRETERGFDHGTFVPLMLAFPEAKIPVAQLSLIRGLDPERHIALGSALQPLRSEGVLIIGSGMSYHNMQGFFSGGPAVESASRRFDDWLAATVAMSDPGQRRAALTQWKRAPGGLESHPRSEHLAPLFIVAGAAGADPGRREYSEMLMNAHIASHVFGA
ncbi:MAG: class III extradiol ring-cleavage dioxygenase [Spirochaetia bacterium]|nr:class III extradiol ring-cleavage dioxygenase [Spirochaetia bacterium]